MVEAGFLEAIDEKALQDVSRWYQSPLARKVTQLQKKESEASAEFKKFVEAMKTAPPPDGRKKLIQSLDESVRASESMVEMMVGINEGLLRGVMSAEGNPPGEDLDQRSKTFRTQMLPVLQDPIQAMLLFTYRTLSDQELKDYLTFLSTPSARAFHRAISRGFEKAFEGASTKASQDLAGAFKPAGKAGK
jgi:hypothetical protein